LLGFEKLTLVKRKPKGSQERIIRSGMAKEMRTTLVILTTRIMGRQRGMFTNCLPSSY